MQLVSFGELLGAKKWVGLGIAGNQAEHLDQAGEAEDFKDVISQGNAPKGMFPWYIPGSNSFLSTNPLSHDHLCLGNHTKLQPEPEIGLIVEFEYEGSHVKHLKVVGFTVFNDCSNRVNAKKISQKKNWGDATQGIAKDVILINDFETIGGRIEDFRLGCYLKRNGRWIQYGIDTAVVDYCYFNDTLIEWIIQQINTQQDQGPLEAIGEMMYAVKPNYGVIGIGATCYSNFGNSADKFLREGDEVLIVCYDFHLHHKESVELLIRGEQVAENDQSLLLLNQKVLKAL